MDFRRLPVLAGPVVAGLLLLGGCAGAPESAQAPTAAAPVAASAPAGQGQAPCTTRLRPGSTGGAVPLRLTPEAQAEIDRLRDQQPTAATPQDPALASRLAEVSQRVERAARPCADR